MRKGRIFLNIAVNQLYTWLGRHIHLILLFILLAAVYWKWWAGGVRVASDFPVVSMPDLKIQFNIPQVWSSKGSVGLGEYSVFTIWAWPMDFIVGVLANFGLTFGILERIMFIIPTLLVGIYSIRNLLEKYDLSKTSKFVATLFYLSTTYLLLLIDGGQLSIGLAYAWFPASYYLFIKSVDGNLRGKIIAGLSVCILGFLDIRFVYILAILLVLRFFYERGEHTLEWIKSGLVTTAIFAAINAYWILPFIKNPLSGARIADLTKSSNLDFTQLKNSVSLLQPHWYENIFGKIHSFRKEFLLIPVFAFLAPILKRKNREVWFWTAVALISVFLTKGANPPFPGVYPWLFAHIPGFSLFRDSTKFFFLVALSYSILIAYTLDAVTKRFPKFKIAFPVLISLYLLFLIRPVYLGGMTGTFSDPRYAKEYSLLTDIFKNDGVFGRILWIPSRPPLGYASPTHASLEASRLESLRPFAVSTVGAYETQNFIREGNYMGELFDIAGIRYIAYPYFDPKRNDIKQEKVDYYNVFLSQIGRLPWIGEKISESPVPVFKTKENRDKFFISANTYFVTGSDKIYRDIKNLGGRFADNALIFAEEDPGLINQIGGKPEAKIILYDKNLTDLTLSFADKSKFIFPADNLDSSPSIKTISLGWWKRSTSDLVWWRDFLQQKYGVDNQDFDYGGGWAVGEGDRQLTINNLQFTNGKELYARVMRSSRGESMEFWQGNTKIGEINTKTAGSEKVEIGLAGHGEIPDKTFIYDKADFFWFRVGDLATDGEITIKTQGEINVLNSLTVISGDEEKSLNTKVESLKSSGRIIDWAKLDSASKKDLFSGKNQATVSYTAISPTHYKIKISGITAESTLFFSETYDKGWELDHRSSYPLYSLINGFSVAKDGEYDLYFTPQKYVYPGLIVSGITLASCIMFLIWKRK